MIIPVSSESSLTPPSGVRNCAFLVANATKNFALATRISQLVASGRLTISCHDHYTNNNFDFQPNREKIKFKAARQLVTYYLPFHCF